MQKILLPSLKMWKKNPQIFSQKFMLKVEPFQKKRKKKNYRNNNCSHKIYICVHTKYSTQHQCVFISACYLGRVDRPCFSCSLIIIKNFVKTHFFWSTSVVFWRIFFLLLKTTKEHVHCPLPLISKCLTHRCWVAFMSCGYWFQEFF